MEFITLIVFVFAIGYCAYRSGKRVGSKKSFHVGRTRRRHRRR